VYIITIFLRTTFFGHTNRLPTTWTIFCIYYTDF